MPDIDMHLRRLTMEVGDAAALVRTATDRPDRQTRYLDNLNEAVAELNTYLRPYLPSESPSGSA